jgi:hypothetical protein
MKLTTVNHLSTEELLHSCSLESRDRLDEDPNLKHLESCPECYEQMLLFQLAQFHDEEAASQSPARQAACSRIVESVLATAEPAADNIVPLPATLSAEEAEADSGTSTTRKNKKRFFYGGGLAAAASLVAAFLFWPQKAQQPPALAFLTMKLGQVEINGRPAKLGQQVQSEDTIHTFAESSAAIQFENAALLVMRQKSRVSLTELKLERSGSLPIVKMFQSGGTSYHRIQKGRARYQVRTPLAVAAVRGTEFIIELGNKKKSETVTLNQGKVEVTPVIAGGSDPKDSTIYQLKAGSKVTIDETRTIQPAAPLDKKDSKLFTRLQKVRSVPLSVDQLRAAMQQTESSEPDSSSAVKIQKQVSQAVQTAGQAAEDPFAGDKAAKTSSLSLAAIKAKYGKLSKIIMNNGTTYIGAFQMQGAQVVIITTKGKIKVKSGDIVQFEELK